MFILRMVYILNTRLWNHLNTINVFPFFSPYHYLSFIKMSTESTTNSSINSVLMPPPAVYNMKILNRDAFKKNIKVPTLDIPVKKLKASLKILKPCLLKMNNLNPVQESNDEKKVLLNPLIFDEKLPYLENMLQKLDLKTVYWSDVTLTYENFNHESIFKAILPPDTGGNVSSFSIIGHIIHLNLKPYLMDYKYIIGEVLLDKYHNIKTVVNKTQTIETEYRNFQMELLAGEPIYDVVVKENGFQYEFNFEKVFWNPRLVQERAEIVKKIGAGHVVFDVFAGVGPFSIPLAHKKCMVFSNDLNPDSYKWLCHNARLNKVEENLTAFNLDGHQFICSVIKRTLIQLWAEENKDCSVHIIMNLPASALTFLDSFQGLLEGYESCNKKLPIVYCYFFLRKDEDAQSVIETYFKADCKSSIKVTPVRLVAPNKKMMRITYEIPASILYHSASDEPALKKNKMM